LRNEQEMRPGGRDVVHRVQMGMWSQGLVETQPDYKSAYQVGVPITSCVCAVYMHECICVKSVSRTLRMCKCLEGLQT
jgi:hypothetical protein